MISEVHVFLCTKIYEICIERGCEKAMIVTVRVIIFSLGDFPGESARILHVVYRLYSNICMRVELDVTVVAVFTRVTI